ncbi:MAG TPA: DUF1501 domain-containing protein, partial [Verrucomicrobiales bacterium]|nr:DUF1501 domain-containing protein [Verrucomicrobiales bacterium]
MSPSTLQSRRRFLQRNALGIGSVALACLLRDDRLLATPPAVPRETRSFDLKPKTPSHHPSARAMISLFMHGGPSHVDLLDPKPELSRRSGEDYPGEITYSFVDRASKKLFGSPWKFERHGECGMEVSELLPHFSRIVDDVCLIRSMHTDINGHEPSIWSMNTGRAQPGRPALGSWVTYGLGSENQNLPGFIAMCPGGYPIQESQNWQSGFLPGVYQGTYIDTRHTDLEKLIEHIRNDYTSLPAQRAQLDLLQQLNARHQQKRSEDAQIEARIQSFELAYRMQMDATDAFDIAKEPEHIRSMYGEGTQARQLLVARRLLEKGVRFIQVWHGAGQPWDNHDDIEVNHRRLAKESDQAIGALLKDLKQRGMLEDTLVIWG